MDTVSSKQRSKNMAAIRSKNTLPEKLVRSALFKEGLRYRLHVKTLPGTPDIVFKKFKLVIDVRGCFWHGHANCKYSSTPKSNVSYWRKKLERNAIRDKRNSSQLKTMKYKQFIIWECEAKNPQFLVRKIKTIVKYVKDKKSVLELKDR